jgi:hypothetical protein
MLLYDHKHIIESAAGVQQGDPLGPLYFCCGIMSLVNEINGFDPVYNKWYMDDGGIVADVSTLLRVWDLLKSKGPALGLHLNPAKCEWSWLDPNRKEPCPIRIEGVSEEAQVKLVPHSEIQMLGVPLGSDAFVSDFVGKKLIGRLQSTISQLSDFEDTQSAFYLLRISFSIVRAVHFMRTTPLKQWLEQGVKFDGMLRKAAEDILGFPMADHTYAQAALTPKLGGLGLRKTVEHAGLAYAASWHEAKRQSREEWVQPPGVSSEHVEQKKASFEFDEQVLAYLVDKAPNDREAQRLRRVAQPHAGSFITAVPSEEDGNDTILRPRNFRIAVAYRLGVPVLAESISCPMCKQTIDKSGDHATCCTHSGDLIVRHNAVRNFVNRVATDALLSPFMEKRGILGETSGRRPGDVTIPMWSSGKSMAIDVAVTSPLAPSSVRLSTPCEEYAAGKHKKYDDGFRNQPWFFSALVLETTGAINAEGEELMRQLFRYAAKRQGREFSSFCGRGWARLSCNLQRAVSQMILARIDGAPVPSSFQLEALVPRLAPVGIPVMPAPLERPACPVVPSSPAIVSVTRSSTHTVGQEGAQEGPQMQKGARTHETKEEKRDCFGRLLLPNLPSPATPPAPPANHGSPPTLPPPPKNDILPPLPPRCFSPHAHAPVFQPLWRTPPFKHFTKVSQSYAPDPGSSSFGHTGLSPFHLSDYVSREEGWGEGMRPCMYGTNGS